MVEYRITAVDVAATPNTAADPASGYHVFFIVDPTPVFIFEPDATPLSGAAIALELDALGIDYDMGTALPDNRSLYSTIFVCLGIYSTNHQLTASEGRRWPTSWTTAVSCTWRAAIRGPTIPPRLSIRTSISTGLLTAASDAGPIEGAVGTFTEGMYFTYSGREQLHRSISLRWAAHSRFS